jgi:signal transduction histidine kinase/ligand-binding sensor domain-containing protein
LLLFAANNSFGATWQNPKFEHFTVKEGLSSNTIYCLHRDSRGFLWIGTNNGLNRFDGYKFTAYRNQLADSNSISNDHISDIFEDDDGMLWIATWKFINKFNPVTGQFYTYKYKTNPESELDCRTNVIEAWNKDTLLIGTNIGPALFCKSNGKFAFFRVNKNREITESDYVFGVKKLTSKKVLVATFDDVYLTNPYTQSAEKLSLEGLQLHKNYAHVTGKIVPYQNNEWLIHTWNCDALIYHEEKHQLRNLFFEKSYNNKDYGFGTLSILNDNNDFIFGTNGKGLFITNQNLKIRNHITHDAANLNGISSNYISSIIKDNEGIYWLGTDHGLNKYDPSNQKLQDYTYKFYSPYFSTEDQLNALFITKNNQLYLQGIWGAYTIDQSSNSVRFLAELNTAVFKNLFGSMKYIKDSMLCIFRGGGFQTFYADNKFPYIKPSKLRDYYIDKNYGTPSDVIFYKGAFYVLFNNQGVFCVDLQKGTFTKLNLLLPNHEVLKAERFNKLEPIRGKEDYFYLGTSPQGLFRVNLNTQHAQKIEIPIIHKSDVLNVTKVCADKYNNLWIATEFQGVLSFNYKSQQWSELEEHDQIGNNHIRNLYLFNDTILAVMVHDAAFFVNLKSKTLINISQAQGLSENVIPESIFLVKNDIYFAHVNGFLKGKYNELLAQNANQGVIITEIFTGNKNKLHFTNAAFVNLKYPENSLRISFASLSFYHPNQNKFEYQFEGQNTDWTDLGTDHELILHKLPYGQYKLFIKEKNSTKGIATINIVVQAPFYLRPWFLIVVIISILILVFFINRILLLKKIAVLNTRDTIARDLHDEVGSALTSISYLSEMGKIQSKTQNPTFEKIGETSRSITALMNDIIWAVNPDKDNALSLIQRINYFIQENQHIKEVSIKFEYSPKLLQHKFNMQQRKSLYLIFKEALNNAFKYAKATEINIRLQKTHAAIILEIEDNGIGFISSNKQGNGLSNMKKRAYDAKGEFEINSALNKGTLIRVIINHHNW